MAGTAASCNHDGDPWEVAMSTVDGKDATITDRDRKLAVLCGACTVCVRARKKQRGLAYWFVRLLEKGICPACAAYERVHGRKAHESIMRASMQGGDGE